MPYIRFSLGEVKKSVRQQCPNSHQGQNAFSNIEKGDPGYKIFGAMSTDPMHLVYKGIVVQAMSLIFE
jgi:hypothetical protein